MMDFVQGGAPVTVALMARGGGYTDLYGKKYATSITLAPQTAAVLLHGKGV